MLKGLAKMEKLNQKEQRVYDYIADSLRRNGYAPSVRDICRDLGYKSTSTVHMYLKRLDMFGYITKDDGKSRAISLQDSAMPNVCAVPLVGVVTAGKPILAAQDIEGYVGYAGKCDIDSMFALRVRGESMIGAGILDGDIIIAEKTCYAENGEIVVAMIDDEATVKRFFRENGHYRLQPENPSMQPIISDEVLIIGKVVAIQRNY